MARVVFYCWDRRRSDVGRGFWASYCGLGRACADMGLLFQLMCWRAVVGHQSGDWDWEVEHHPLVRRAVFKEFGALRWRGRRRGSVRIGGTAKTCAR